MRAVLIDPSLVGADKFHVGDTPDPEVGPGQVPVEVTAVALGAWEKGFALDDDARSVERRTKKHRVNLGLEFSGVVRGDGREFRAGQRVMGGVHLTKDDKALAQYVAVDESALAPVPDEVDLVAAAVLPVAGDAALTALDAAKVGRGSRVLVVGASGGVGVTIVQIAVARGADVVAIGSGAAVDGLRGFGVAAHDYRETGVDDVPGSFDAVFDLTGTLRFRSIRRRLTARGAFVLFDPQKDVTGIIAAAFGRKRMPLVYVPQPRADKQRRVLDLVADGTLVPVVDEVHEVSDLHAAVEALMRGGRFGRIVVTM